MASKRIERYLSRVKFPNEPYRSVVKNYEAPENVNPNICAECGGECCKRCGCEFSPDDFEEISFDFLKKEIEKGFITIEFVDVDTYDQLDGSLILRIRNINSPIVDSARKKTPCILFTENGCKLDYAHRPTGGRLLKPTNKKSGTIIKHRSCSSTYSIYSCLYEWWPHQKVLYDLAEYFKDKDYPCSI